MNAQQEVLTFFSSYFSNLKALFAWGEKGGDGKLGKENVFFPFGWSGKIEERK